MAEVLSQNEIEALLAAMAMPEEAQDTSPQPAAAKRTAAAAPAVSTHAEARQIEGKVVVPLHKRRRANAGKLLGSSGAHLSYYSGPMSYEPYDFRRPDKLSKEHLRSLQILHETFSNYLASSLAAYLRSPVQIEVVSVEQVPYDEYTKSISASLINILNVSPLSGQAIFELDFTILFSMIDRLLGGTGAAGKIVRDLTDVEKVLSENMVQIALGDLQSAWENVCPLTFDIASMDTSSQFVQIVPGNDTVVLVLFEIHMGDFHGAMSICIPYLLIKPILSKLSSQRWLSSANKRPSVSYRTGLAERLRTTRVPCVARLGTATITVSDVTTMTVGQILKIAVPNDAEMLGGGSGRIGSVDLIIGNNVKFRGRTGLRGKKLAVQIDQVVVAPPELVSNKELPHA